MRGEWKLPRPARVSLHVGEPLLPDGSDLPSLVRLRERAAEAIAQLCDEPRVDVVAAGPAPPPSEPPA